MCVCFFYKVDMLQYVFVEPWKFELVISSPFDALFYAIQYMQVGWSCTRLSCIGHESGALTMCDTGQPAMQDMFYSASQQHFSDPATVEGEINEPQVQVAPAFIKASFSEDAGH